MIICLVKITLMYSVIRYMFMVMMNTQIHIRPLAYKSLFVLEFKDLFNLVQTKQLRVAI